MRWLLLVAALPVAAATPAFHAVDACSDQAGAPLWSHGDLAWLNGTTHRDDHTVWVDLNGDILDCDAMFADPTYTDTWYRYTFTHNGTDQTGTTMVCASLPIACIQSQVVLSADACEVTNIVLASMRDDGTPIDRVPDEGGATISGCHLFDPPAESPATPPASSADNDTAPEDDVRTPEHEAPLPLGLCILALLWARRRS